MRASGFRLLPAASESELEMLRSAVGQLPEEAEAWFRWHAGSGDGLFPGTSWGLLTVAEARAEHDLAKTLPELNGLIFVPIVTGRDGRVMLLVTTAAGLEVWAYDRGDRVEVTAFEAWTERLLAAWSTEAAVLRVQWVRRQRSPMGWNELHLPTRARAKFKAMLAQLPFFIRDVERLDGTSPARFQLGATPAWATDEGDRLVVTLTMEAAAELVAALADRSQDSFFLPGVDGCRVVFAAQ